jgi:hypothetical protein
MRTPSFLALITLIAFAAAAPAAHATSLSAVGVFNFSKVTEDPAGTGYTLGNSTGVGLGALLGAPLFPGLELQIGALYFPRGTHVEGSYAGFTAGNLNLTAKQLQVPVLVRFTLLPVLSAGVGAYYARALSDFELTGDIAGVSIPSVTRTDLKKDDFGLVASVSANFPIVPLFSILVDARYLLGLSNVNTGTATSRYRDIQLLAGVSFSI